MEYVSSFAFVYRNESRLKGLPSTTCLNDSLRRDSSPFAKLSWTVNIAKAKTRPKVCLKVIMLEYETQNAFMLSQVTQSGIGDLEPTGFSSSDFGLRLLSHRNTVCYLKTYLVEQLMVTFFLIPLC